MFGIGGLRLQLKESNLRVPVGKGPHLGISGSFLLKEPKDPRKPLVIQALQETVLGSLCFGPRFSAKKKLTSKSQGKRVPPVLKVLCLRISDFLVVNDSDHMPR